MRVLVACEYSGTVRDAFIAAGHDAVSCDLLPTDKPGPHIRGDCIPVIKQGWDIIIMHPPCTALTVAGNSTYGEGQRKYDKRIEAVEWTVKLWELAKANARIGVCMENPVGVLPRMGGIKPAQYIQPYEFGHPEQKKTGLWLDRLPLLRPTINVYSVMMGLPKNQRERLHYLPPSADRWKIRSTTFQGIADAMAAQWGDICQD
jgi:site-specific DNA-cytosine methylase